MARTEIRIAGFGGQGVILAGVLLGQAAVLYDGRHAIQTQTYGAAARGGAARSDVIIDSAPIVYPQVTAPDIMAVLTNQALDKYLSDLRPDAVLIIDSGLVNPPADTALKVLGVPATHTAVSEFKKSIVANMIVLGFLVAATDIVSIEAVERAVRGGVPKGTDDLNAQALLRGVSLYRETYA